MKLGDLQNDLQPAAKRAIERGLTYLQAETALRLVLIAEALEQTHGNQKTAAAKLGMSEALLSRSINGQFTKPSHSGNRKNWKQRHQESPSQVIGSIGGVRCHRK